MRKLLIALLSLLILQTGYALDTAKLRMKIAGPIQDNRYFLCVSQVGCVSILNGNKGKVYPMNPGNVSNIVAINLIDRRMHPQSLPGSCNVAINEKQTMTISGKLVKNSQDQVMIKNMHCSVN